MFQVKDKHNKWKALKKYKQKLFFSVSSSDWLFKTFHSIVSLKILQLLIQNTFI